MNKVDVCLIHELAFVASCSSEQAWVQYQPHRWDLGPWPSSLQPQFPHQQLEQGHDAGPTGCCGFYVHTPGGEAPSPDQAHGHWAITRSC